MNQANTKHGNGNNNLAIDIDKVIEDKFKKKLPSFFISWIKRLIHQDEINEVLRTHGHLDGLSFAAYLIDYFKLSLTVKYTERLPQDPRSFFISNHPLGALDGICLIHTISQHYDKDVRYIVNDLLLHLAPFKETFVPVNTLSNQSRESVYLLNQALKSDLPVISFPAGICSRKINGKITDLPWKASFIKQAIRSKRDIVPLYFEGQNTDFFYNIERLRKFLGIKFNIGTALLSREMFHAKGNEFTVKVGKPISYERLIASGFEPQELSTLLRNRVYALAHEK